MSHLSVLLFHISTNFLLKKLNRTIIGNELTPTGTHFMIIQISSSHVLRFFSITELNDGNEHYHWTKEYWSLWKFWTFTWTDTMTHIPKAQDYIAIKYSHGIKLNATGIQKLNDINIPFRSWAPLVASRFTTAKMLLQPQRTHTRETEKK